MFRILPRSILGELFKVFIPSLIGITGLIVLATIVKEASDHGLSPSQVLVAITLIVPSMMPFIIPPTTLFATCVVFGRMAHDNEVTAIKSAGISVLRVVWPGAILGLAMSAVLFGMYCYVIPYSHHILRTAFVNDAEEYILAVLKRDHEIRRELRLNWEIWVEQVHGRQLRTAIFKRRDAKGHYDVIARAREAELHVDAAKREVLVQMRHGEVLDEAGKTRVHFEEKDYSVPLPDIDKNHKGTPREMTWNELIENRRGATAKLQGLTSDLEKLASSTTAADPATLAQRRSYLEFSQRGEEQLVRMLDVELQLRPALSFGCLFFVLVGCPVGIWFSRSDYLSAFITCFLPIVFIYYPVYLCFTNLAKDGRVHPALAQWIANAILGVIALGLFRKLLKH
jgi:lipopolysaccharide export system permease protein